MGAKLQFAWRTIIPHFSATDPISERTRDGIAAARKRGRRPGRPALDWETIPSTQALVALHS